MDLFTAIEVNARTEDKPLDCGSAMWKFTCYVKILWYHSKVIVLDSNTMLFYYTPLYWMITIVICHCILHHTQSGLPKRGNNWICCPKPGLEGAQTGSWRGQFCLEENCLLWPCSRYLKVIDSSPWSTVILFFFFTFTKKCVALRCFIFHQHFIFRTSSHC